MFPVDTEALGRCVVSTARGDPVLVGTAWAQRPAVLVWLRHFG